MMRYEKRTRQNQGKKERKKKSGMLGRIPEAAVLLQPQNLPAAAPQQLIADHRSQGNASGIHRYHISHAFQVTRHGISKARSLPNFSYVRVTPGMS
jgi:hypothetical protein